MYVTPSEYVLPHLHPVRVISAHVKLISDFITTSVMIRPFLKMETDVIVAGSKTDNIYIRSIIIILYSRAVYHLSAH